MRRAVEDITKYLKTISTNIISDRQLRQNLIEKLDLALKNARKQRHDEPLIKAYKEVGQTLYNSTYLNHNLVSSDLLETVRKTLSDIKESALLSGAGLNIKTKKDRDLDDKNRDLENNITQMREMMENMQLMMQSMMQSQKQQPSLNQFEYSNNDNNNFFKPELKRK